MVTKFKDLLANRLNNITKKNIVQLEYVQIFFSQLLAALFQASVQKLIDFNIYKGVVSLGSRFK